MADETIRREASLNVIGILNTVEVVLVTGDAIARCSGEPVFMTLNAIEWDVGASQRELGLIVVKSRSGNPIVDVVANHTIPAETRLKVIGIHRGLVIGFVTSDAIGRCSCELLGVTARTIEPGMSANQLKFRRMLESAQFPTDIGYLVADLAIGGETGKDVIWFLGIGVIVEVTANTINRRKGEFIPLLVDVAIFTARRRMGTNQWKQRVLVVGQHGNSIVPTLRVVTGNAIVSQTALVNIRMAIVTSCPDLLKFQILVAGGTVTVEMPASQWKSGGAVIELTGVDGVPVRGRVANRAT